MGIIRGVVYLGSDLPRVVLALVQEFQRRVLETVSKYTYSSVGELTDKIAGGTWRKHCLGKQMMRRSGWICDDKPKSLG